MKIKELFSTSRPTFSFEFFPPKTDEAEAALFAAIRELKALKPAFVSVTCGAMGTTKTKTAFLASRIREELAAESIAHLTCVAADREEIETTLQELLEKGIQNVLALRGDPPQGYENFKRPENGFAYASELVSFIRQRFGDDLSIGVAGYPEGHPECPDKELDLEHLAAKVARGADFMITQLFLINQNFFSFVERCRRKGMRVPIVPGIMPITSSGQLAIFAEKCGTVIPREVSDAAERFGGDKAALEEYGIEYATRQCEELLRNGVSGIHFYTLNRSKATRRIFENLRLTGS